MSEHEITLAQRHAALREYIEHRLQEGYSIISESETSAELYKPSSFPEFLRKEQTLYVVVDERGHVWVQKSNY